MIDVSVLITCYNKEKYLDECVQSVLRQTRIPKEIIIVHDGCEEPMAHVHATTIILKENIGVSKSRHEAFRFSTGKLILFLDGDDVLSPDYLEKMTMTIYRGADMSYPDTFFWTEHGNKLMIAPGKIDPRFVEQHEKVVVPVTCLMKREVYEKVGGFREWSVLEDVDFWVRALACGFKFRKSQTLLWYRRYNGTRNTVDFEKRKAVMKEILNQFTFENGGVRLGKDKL